MTRSRRRFLAPFAALLLVGACVHSPPTGNRVHEDRSVLMQAQMTKQSFPSLYEAIEALRSNWFNERSADSFYNATHIVVYMDANRLGGVDMLRGIPISTAVSVKHFDPVEAQARWGVGHSQGVIQVLTR